MPEEIGLYIFADERKNINDRWDYIAILIVPGSNVEKALKILNKHRNEVGYYNELKFGKINKKPKGEKFKLARRWLQEIIRDGKENRGIFYFNILGIDRNNLDFQYFGNGNTPKGKYANVYNKFFRTVFLSAIKSFFYKYNKIVIKGIFHDSEGNLETHKYFSWHLIWKIKQTEDKIQFENDRIVFINSDKNKEKTKYKKFSDFIQLVDLIVGSVSYCLDYSNPHNIGQKELAKIMLPLVDRVVNNPSNKNSSFGYFGKYRITFFPKQELTENDLYGNKLTGKIYTKRKIQLKEGKLTLF